MSRPFLRILTQFVLMLQHKLLKIGGFENKNNHFTSSACMKYVGIILIFIGCCLLLVAHVADIINPNVTIEYEEIATDKKENRHKTHPKLDGSFNNLFWFVQVTDTHINEFKNFRIAPDLKEFCQEQLKVIKPDFVIATGDLTDAKLPDNINSKQSLKEWKQYKDVVSVCKEYYGSVWLDIKGNHDAFDVPDFDSPQNMFRMFSSQGNRHKTSYSYTHSKPYGNYTFIGVDTTQNPGLKRPFNFFGYLTDERAEELMKLTEESRKSNVTLYFGHYPTSIIVADNYDIRQVLKDGIAYLNGHLHTLANMVTRLYTLHKTGTLELELGDWKDNRRYRILAIDHDLLSFTDQVSKTWPVILITNPKNLMFLAPKFESLDKIKESSYIRFLVFTPGQVKSAVVYMNDNFIGNGEHVSGPLFTLLWEPQRYSAGLHTLKITVEDLYGNYGEVEQPFSLDGSQPVLPLVGRVILMLDVAQIGRAIFYTVSIAYILLLVLLKRLRDVSSISITVRSQCFRGGAIFFNNCLRRLWQLTQHSKLFYPFLVFHLNLMFGPWFIGYVLNNHIGVMFIWGLFVKGTLIKDGVTHIYGVFHLITFSIPALFYTSFCLDYFQYGSGRNCVRRSLFHKLRHIYIPFLALLVIQLVVTFTEFPRAYGTTAVVLGPVRTGSVVLLIVLHVLASRKQQSIGSETYS